MIDVRDVRLRALTGMGLLAALAAAVFGVLYYVTVRTVTGRQLGDASLRGALFTESAVEDSVAAVLDVVSTATLLGAVAVVAVIALLRLDRDRGIAAVGILVAANVSTYALKNYLLTRPDLGLDEVAPATLNSLPSGHTTAAFSAVAALLFVLPRQIRLAAAGVGAAFATVTALATMSAGWHRAADSMAAFLLVGFWTVVAATVFVATRPQTQEWPSIRLTPLKWLGATAVGCLALGLILTAGLAVADPVRESAPGAWVAFFDAVLLIVGTVSAVLMGVLRVIDLVDATADLGA